MDLDERVERLVGMLRTDGDLEVRTTPQGTGPAMLDLRIKAPGGEAGHDIIAVYASAGDEPDAARQGADATFAFYTGQAPG